MLLRYVRLLMSKRRFLRESRVATTHMEKEAQKNIDARLTRLELVYKNKTRVK